MPSNDNRGTKSSQKTSTLIHHNQKEDPFVIDSAITWSNELAREEKSDLKTRASRTECQGTVLF